MFWIISKLAEGSMKPDPNKKVVSVTLLFETCYLNGRLYFTRKLNR